MIRASYLVEQLGRTGFGLFSGTPCSFLTPVINTVIDAPEVRYIGAANEGDAVAVACGADLGGVRGVVLFQNSGLGNAVNPLTSLAIPFRIPVLVLTTWRGQPGRPPDEPQHELMGQITPSLLGLMGIPWEEVPEQEAAIPDLLGRAAAHLTAHGTPFGLILKEGTVSPYQLRARPERGPCLQVLSPPPPQKVSRHDPDDALRTVRSAAGEDAVIVATTGYTGRALYALGDRPNQFYMVGSMGCASSIGLGLAAVRPRRRVVVIDGDGALLMRMGALATLGQQRPPNLIHVLLDNGVHESTGGQATASSTVDYATAARACGYPRVVRVDGLSELEAVLHSRDEGLTFLDVKTLPRSSRKLPRPTVTPAQVAERLRRWLEAT